MYHNHHLDNFGHWSFGDCGYFTIGGPPNEMDTTTFHSFVCGVYLPITLGGPSDLKLPQVDGEI